MKNDLHINLTCESDAERETSCSLETDTFYLTLKFFMIYWRKLLEIYLPAEFSKADFKV